jgi:hypothetical protein
LSGSTRGEWVALNVSPSLLLYREKKNLTFFQLRTATVAVISKLLLNRRNIIRGPGYFSGDASLMRKFQITERLALQFEAQGFNLFNRTNFNLPERFVDEPTTFGRIFSARCTAPVPVDRQIYLLDFKWDCVLWSARKAWRIL